MKYLIKRLEQAGLAIAGVCLVTIMVIITADALGRYAFGAPLGWVTEVVGNYLMVIVVYFSISATFTSGDHIHLDLFQSRMSRRVRAATGIFYSLLAGVVFTLMAIGNIQYMLEAYHRIEFIPGYVPWRVWPSYLLIAIGSALLAVRLFHHAVMLFMKGEDPYVVPEGEGGE